MAAAAPWSRITRAGRGVAKPRAGCENGEEPETRVRQIEGEAGLALERALGVDRRDSFSIAVPTGRQTFSLRWMVGEFLAAPG